MAFFGKLVVSCIVVVVVGVPVVMKIGKKEDNTPPWRQPTVEVVTFLQSEAKRRRRRQKELDEDQ
jgi:hypothetical protein